MRYDMFSGRGGYFQAAESQFPNANSFKLYGSPSLTSGRKIPKTVEVRFCPECRKAEGKWKRFQLLRKLVRRS